MDQVYWDMLQDVLVIAIQVIVPPLLVYLGVLAKKGFALIEARITAEIGATNYAMLAEMVGQAVLAAEQLGLTEKIANEGEDKKAFVMQYVQSALNVRGIYIDVNEIDAAVEAAVLEAFG